VLVILPGFILAWNAYSLLAVLLFLFSKPNNTSSGASWMSCSVGSGGFFLRSKVVSARSWLRTSVWYQY